MTTVCLFKPRSHGWRREATHARNGAPFEEDDGAVRVPVEDGAIHAKRAAEGGCRAPGVDRHSKGEPE